MTRPYDEERQMEPVKLKVAEGEDSMAGGTREQADWILKAIEN